MSKHAGPGRDGSAQCEAATIKAGRLNLPSDFWTIGRLLILRGVPAQAFKKIA